MKVHNIMTLLKKPLLFYDKKPRVGFGRKKKQKNNNFSLLLFSAMISEAVDLKRLGIGLMTTFWENLAPCSLWLLRQYLPVKNLY